MTETIGWGDVDLDVTPPRRRRLRGLLLWPALLAVVAGIALAPSARARLAGNAVAWLGRSWAIAQAYDATRAALEEQGLQRAAPGDHALYARLVTLLDSEEASRLRGIARAIGRRHTWRSDVHAVAATMRRALTAEAADLEADAGRTSVTFSSDVFLETPTQAPTQSLLLAAGRALDQLSRRHHVRLRYRLGPTDTRLTSGTQVLATLDRLTDSPVNVRLAISHDGTLDIWDLATGKGRIDVANGPENLDFTQPVIRLGAGALFATDQGFRLVRTDGSTAARLPSASGYLPAGDNAVWLMLPSGFRRYDSHGHAVGPAYPPPPAFADGGALSATANSLVMAENHPDTQMQTAALWTPSTGKVRPVGSACVGAITGSRDAIAYVGCDQESLTVMDARSGRVRTVHAPPRTVVDEGGMALSPDGSRLAFRASPLDGVDTNSSLVVFDARTGGVTVIAQAAVPLSWSPDGTTLLVSSDVGENAYSIPLGYWRTGMDHPVPIRITLTGQSVSAVLLP